MQGPIRCIYWTWIDNEHKSKGLRVTWHDGEKGEQSIAVPMLTLGPSGWIVQVRRRMGVKAD